MLNSSFRNNATIICAPVILEAERKILCELFPRQFFKINRENYLIDFIWPRSTKEKNVFLKCYIIIFENQNHLFYIPS